MYSSSLLVSLLSMQVEMGSVHYSSLCACEDGKGTTPDKLDSPPATGWVRHRVAPGSFCRVYLAWTLWYKN